MSVVHTRLSGHRTGNQWLLSGHRLWKSSPRSGYCEPVSVRISRQGPFSTTERPVWQRQTEQGGVCRWLRRHAYHHRQACACRCHTAARIFSQTLALRVCQDFRAAFPCGRRPPGVAASSPQDLGMDRLAEAFPYGCATPIRHPQSSVALRFEAATHMARYFHTHGSPRCGASRRMPVSGRVVRGRTG